MFVDQMKAFPHQDRPHLHDELSERKRHADHLPRIVMPMQDLIRSIPKTRGTPGERYMEAFPAGPELLRCGYPCLGEVAEVTRQSPAAMDHDEEVTRVSSAQPPYPGPGHQPHGSAAEPVSELVQRASQQLTELVRGELKLAQAEMKEKGKRYGKGGGLFGGAGVVGFLMLQALVAAAIAALAVPLPVWAAALIITGVLGAIAAVMALTGKKQVSEAAPPAPEEAIENVKADVAEIKESARR